MFVCLFVGVSVFLYVGVSVCLIHVFSHMTQIQIELKQISCESYIKHGGISERASLKEALENLQYSNNNDSGVSGTNSFVEHSNHSGELIGVC